ncbi:unnamed protein product, partial [Larinioides sclopetarius]
KNTKEKSAINNTVSEIQIEPLSTGSVFLSTYSWRSPILSFGGLCSVSFYDLWLCLLRADLNNAINGKR